MLKVPIVPVVALTGEGIKELVSNIKNAKSPDKIKPKKDLERWFEIGKIVKSVEQVEHKHHKLRERLEDLTIKPATGVPIAFGVIFISFWIVRLIGETLSESVLMPIFSNYYQPLLMSFGDWLGDGWIYNILISQDYGQIVFSESLGILTTGLYIPLAVVLPYIIAFYFMLSLLEDSGYLPRLATLSDNVFHKLGMHGYGIIPLFLGLGCNVPGALATRSLETRKQRFIAATLLGVSVPCIAQTAMIFGILGEHGLYYIFLVFLTLVILYVTIGFILNKFIKGVSPEIFLEIPPYRRPSLKTTGKKTWMRVKWFVKEAVPFMIVGVAAINILYTVGFLQWLATTLQPIMETLFGLPGGASIAMVTGFLRKDLAVGMLLSLNMSPLQLVIAATMLTIYFPCVATFIVLLKELGAKDMLKSAAIMISTAVIVGFLMKIILLGV